jgi:hypothetical protein
MSTPRLPEVSDYTLALMLERRLRGVRAFQLFVRALGPKDVVYASAHAWSPDDDVVICSASAEEFHQTFLQLLLNLDQATAPETDDTEGDLP